MVYTCRGWCAGLLLPICLWVLLPTRLCVYPFILWSDTGFPPDGTDSPQPSKSTNDIHDILNSYLGNGHRVNVFLSREANMRSFNLVKAQENKELAHLLQLFEKSPARLLHWVDSFDTIAGFVSSMDRHFHYSCERRADGTNDEGCAMQRGLHVYVLPHTNAASADWACFGHALRASPGSTSTKACQLGPNLNILAPIELFSPVLMNANKLSFIHAREDGVVDQPVNPSGIVNNGVFRSFDGCIYFYSYSCSVTLNNKTTELPLSFADPSHSLCANDKSSLLRLDFTNNIGDWDLISVTFSFASTGRRWHCENILVTFSKTGPPVAQESINLACAQLRASLEVSYTCDHFVFLPNTTLANSPDTYLTFSYFQVQPFVTSNQNERFSPSENCSYFITIPIIMGLLAILICAAILYSGVLALYHVGGPTRSENPKEFINLGATIK